MTNYSFMTNQSRRLSQFSGIHREHFKILEQDYDDITKEERSELRSLLDLLVEAIRSGIKSRQDPRLVKTTAVLHSGSISRLDHPFITLGEEVERKVQFPHYGCYLDPNELKTYVTCEGMGAYYKFLGACKTAPEEIVRVLSGLHNYSLVIIKRRPLPQPRKFEFLYDDPLAIIECPATVENIEQLAKNLDPWFESKEFYPAVLVGISINRNIVVERGALLVHDIVDAISAMQPYRDLVHDWE